MNRHVKIFQVYSKCYLSILSGHFDGPLLVTSATKKNKKTKQKENRKMVHMHTGNTKVRKFYISKYDRQEQMAKLIWVLWEG